MIWLEKLACDGDEEDLGSCLSKSEMWGDNNCTHDTDVGVICKGTDYVELFAVVFTSKTKLVL